MYVAICALMLSVLLSTQPVCGWSSFSTLCLSLLFILLVLLLFYLLFLCYYMPHCLGCPYTASARGASVWEFVVGEEGRGEPYLLRLMPSVSPPVVTP
jgi:hypothetical protein